MESKKLTDEQVKGVSTLNTWSEKQLQEAQEYLEAGYYVTGSSYCIGHTLAKMMANEFIKLMKEKYGDRIEVVEWEGWGMRCVHLK